MKEAEFLKMVLDLAKICGWLRHHQRPGLMRSGKWCSAIQGDIGFPDLVLCRIGGWDGAISRCSRLIIAELKTDTGRPTKQQAVWLEIMKEVHAEVYLWRPGDWPQIEEILK